MQGTISPQARRHKKMLRPERQWRDVWRLRLGQRRGNLTRWRCEQDRGEDGRQWWRRARLRREEMATWERLPSHWGCAAIGTPLHVPTRPWGSHRVELPLRHEPPSRNICLAIEIRCVPVHYSRFNIKTTPPTQPPGQHTSFSLAPSHIGFRIAAHRQINLAPSPCSALWLAAAADDQSPRSPDAAMPVSFPPGLE
jgi:hypothetical protein